MIDGRLVDIALRGEFISYISEKKEASGTSVVKDGVSLFSSTKTLAVYPGLCNMHSHAPMIVMRGLGDDQPLDRWLHDYIWPVEKSLTDEKVYRGTMQACREILSSGTTFINDMYFRLPSMARAIEESGLKARLGLNVFGDAEELDDDNVLKMLASRSKRISYSVAPHSIYTVSEIGLRHAATVCTQLGLPMHIHMSETEKEVSDCLLEHGCRPWEWLEKIGVLEAMQDNIIAAHCLHLSAEEIALMGRYGVTAVHCPNSNLKLGSGYRFPLRELIDAGVTVRLGTDGAASSNNLDMIEVMKTTALLQKGWRGDPTEAPASQMIELATANHKIAVGEDADLFLVDAKTLSNLIYATHGESVEMTIVGGEICYIKKYVK